MYQINEESLKYAYTKLKKYVYYYNSSNYLKDKLIKFEDDLKTNDNLFQEYAEELNMIGQKNYNCLDKYRIDFIFYPKKDSFEKKGDNINIDNVNAFIDMDLIFYLNDILFCFELYDVYKTIDNKHFFGNLFDKHLERVENPLANNMLFDAYWPNYQKWENSLTEAIERKSISGKATLVKIDFQRCFYQTRFNLKELLKKYEIDLTNPIVNIALNIYELYSFKIYQQIGDVREKDVVQLPLGLPSSCILQNILFSNFDVSVANNQIVLSYARYVDDVLMIVGVEFVFISELNKFIKEIRSDENDPSTVSIDVNHDCLNPLNINSKKIEIRKITSLSSIKGKVKKVILPSMLDFIEEENSELSSEQNTIDDSYSQVCIKNVINTFFENEVESTKMHKFLITLNDADLLNTYSSWNKIICVLRKNEEHLSSFEDRINSLINKINDSCCDNFFTRRTSNAKLKETLNYKQDDNYKLLKSLDLMNKI